MLNIVKLGRSGTGKNITEKLERVEVLTGPDRLVRFLDYGNDRILTAPTTQYIYSLRTGTGNYHAITDVAHDPETLLSLIQ